MQEAKVKQRKEEAKEKKRRKQDAKRRRQSKQQGERKRQSKWRALKGQSKRKGQRQAIDVGTDTDATESVSFHWSPQEMIWWGEFEQTSYNLFSKTRIRLRNGMMKQDWTRNEDTTLDIRSGQ